MSGPLDYIVWLIIPVLQIGVVLCSLRAHSFLRYFPLNFYMLTATVLTVGRFLFFSHYGVASAPYFYFYYFSDVLMTICLFFALMALFSHVFREMGAKLYIRIGAIVVLGLISAISYGMVRPALDQMRSDDSIRVATRFVAELSQNLYFVGAVLTYVLWAAVRKMRETRTDLIQLVLSLGVYFSAFAANWALAVIFPNSPIWRFGPIAMALWLPVAWGYTFLKIPEGARLSTARVAMGSR